MKLITALIVLISALFLVTTCCDDCDDCPVCPEPEAEEHLFYIAPVQGNKVKIFSAEQQLIIDSIIVDSVGESQRMRLHVIGDDSLLAVSAGYKTYIVDLGTKVIINSFDIPVPVFSRDSRFYFSNNGLYLYPEQTLVFTDPYARGFTKFCNQSEIMTYQYYVSAGDPIELGFYNILGGASSHSIKTWHGNPVTFFASQAVIGLEKTFIDAATFDALGVCDFNSDTLRFLKSFPFYGTTALIVSLDEKYVYFTDYGPKMIGYPPSGYVFVWDAESEDSVAAIPFQGIDMLDMLVMSYDDRYLLGRPYNVLDEYTTFCLIDAKNHETIGVYDFGALTGNVTAKYCTRNMNYY